MKRTYLLGIPIILFALAVFGICYSFDDTNPIITLHGDKTIILPLGQSFVEPGYSAYDNRDGDIKTQVQINGHLDINKEGTYVRTYYVKDRQGNDCEVNRTIIISDVLSLSLKEFTLEGLYPNVMLKENGDTPLFDIEHVIFAGDSMALYYSINELVPGTRLWYRNSLSPETALTYPIYINYQDTKKTFVENLKEKKPEAMILTLGTNSVAFTSHEYFISNYRKLIEEMKEASPNTQFIVQSIPPVDKQYDENGKETTINNTKINHMNYYLLEMCHALNIPFLNSASSMKDENGQCRKGYCIEKDGIHPSKEGHKALFAYAEKHRYS